MANFKKFHAGQSDTTTSSVHSATHWNGGASRKETSPDLSDRSGLVELHQQNRSGHGGSEAGYGTFVIAGRLVTVLVVRTSVSVPAPPSTVRLVRVLNASVAESFPVPI